MDNTMSIPFFRVDDVSNELVFVVDTESLFVPSCHHPISYSPSKYINFNFNFNFFNGRGKKKDSSTYTRSGNSNLLEKKGGIDDLHCLIMEMPDPQRIYPSVFHYTSFKTTWRKTYVTVPNIRDHDGDVIMPYQYRSRLKDQSVVIVNVYLKLYVSFFLKNSIEFILPL
jgi:hypothetical protein